MPAYTHTHTHNHLDMPHTPSYFIQKYSEKQRHERNAISHLLFILAKLPRVFVFLKRQPNSAQEHKYLTVKELTGLREKISELQ